MKKILLLFICLFMSFSNTFAANTGYYISSAEAAKFKKKSAKSVSDSLIRTVLRIERYFSLMQIVQEKLILSTGTDRL